MTETALATKKTRPPRFRGSDFAMRFAQGRWSEERILEAINSTEYYRAIPYGRSQVGPDKPEEIAEYWEKYTAVESVGKRPDLLVLPRHAYESIRAHIPEDPTIADDEELALVLKYAICGIEAENSLWVAKKMPDYGKTRITKKATVAPTVIVKAEDLPGLNAWQARYGIPVYVTQVFYDVAYIGSLDYISNSISNIQTVVGDKENTQRQRDLGVLIKKQEYADSRSGTSTTKLTYNLHYSKALVFGELEKAEPRPCPQVYVEKNGKIIPYVEFQGGSLRLSDDLLALFDRLADAKCD